MDYTPLAHLTDEEFVTHLSTKDNPTDAEMEAMLRMERMLEDKKSNPKTHTKYVEAA